MLADFGVPLQKHLTETGGGGPGYLFYISDLDYGEPGTFYRIEKS